MLLMILAQFLVEACSSPKPHLLAPIVYVAFEGLVFQTTTRTVPMFCLHHSVVALLPSASDASMFFPQTSSKGL